MKIVFDMDNTLTDEFGSSARPGIERLLERLKKDGHTLILWTNSKRDRAKTILLEHNLRKFFEAFIYREDYDPEEKGLKKDIRKRDGDFLIDDDPSEIDYIKTIGKRGYRISPYRKGSNPSRDELDILYKEITKSKSILKKLFG